MAVSLKVELFILNNMACTVELFKVVFMYFPIFFLRHLTELDLLGR